jgi:hypothetical protein
VVVEKVTHEVDPEKSELEKQLAIQKADLESVFASQLVELEAEWASKLSSEKKEHESMLKMSELLLQVEHSKALSELELKLQTEHSLAQAQLISTVHGCEIEILGLQRELEPFLQDREHSTMLARFMSQDAASVTDTRVDDYRARGQQFTVRQPLSLQRRQQLPPNTEEAFRAFPATQPTQTTLLPALPPVPTQQALPPPLIFPALLPPPTPKIEDQQKNV